jgi:replicative superfamily II helicase
MEVKLHNPQEIREKYIRELNAAGNSTQRAKDLADDLFALDLTVYSRDFSFDSLVYTSFAKSIIDENIAMHPEQIAIINEIYDNDALIISAPTSFGKTYCVFEYIVRHEPHNVVLIVPTLALADEYLKKIIKRFKSSFLNYKIHTSLSEDKTYDFEGSNIFILTHDRVVQETAYSLIKVIDLLVIDEVYKLESDPANDRVLVLNMAYYYLAKKAKKYILLAPFINEILDIEKLDKKPKFYCSAYSPVVNDVKIIDILNENDRNSECDRIVQELGETDKTLIYFPTVSEIYKYINKIVVNYPPIDTQNKDIAFFIDWAKEEVHDEWSLIKALERGYLIHNGQLPIGTRLFQMDFYESSQEFNRMLCTSTLLEGVNTTAKSIVITKPSRTPDRSNNHAPFTAFDFFNLVGRTGRLYQHYLGTAYYIKSPTDPEYKRDEAVKSIRFELTDNSKDIDIQKGNIDKYDDVKNFLSRLNITIEEYRQHIGSRPRFDTVVAIYERYISSRHELLQELQTFIDNPQHGRYSLVLLLCSIIENNTDKLKANITNKLLDKRRPKLKKIINEIYEGYKRKIPIDHIITTTIKLKMSYIEHDFYTKIKLIKFFMERNNVKFELINKLEEKIISSVEQLYFSASKHKKMLLDMGIYERDVESIIKIIGDDFNDAVELKYRLSDNLSKLANISFVSKYIIRNLV